MTIKSNTLVLAALAVLLTSGLALAEDAAPTLGELDGKELYKQVCKTCHAEGAEAGEYTPMSLIMEQWDEFYDETFATVHADVVCPADAARKVTDILDADMIKKLRKFCVDHAADSESPMTCG